MGETRGSYYKKALVVSQTEPTNPSDGLLWYKPDLCLTTTTTTRIPCDYEGVMTVGADGEYYGYDGVVGSIDPEDGIIYLDWYSASGLLELCITSCYDEIIVYINDVSYIVPFGMSTKDGSHIYELTNILSNPFPAVGETCQIGLCYGTPCTTTTTPQP